jgi:tRNA(Ile2) C34 agmatinyltransferase TiaS
VAKEVMGLDILAMKTACEKLTPYLRPDCPECGWALETTPDDIRHCKLCGYQTEYPIKRHLEKV